MNDRLKQLQQRSLDRLERMQRRIEGDGPIEKQILLVKLIALREKVPSFTSATIDANSPEREWIASVGAILKRLDKIGYGIKFDSNVSMLQQYKNWAVNQITGLMMDAIEVVRLELELDGRSDIGSAYDAGDVYRYFADLKEIIRGATRGVMVVDPYVDGPAFDAYFADTPSGISVQILSGKFSKDVVNYADRHAKQFGTSVEVRRSRETHDRVVLVDESDCWFTGGSLNHAAMKTTYLVPAQPEIAAAKIQIYSDIWDRADVLR